MTETVKKKRKRKPLPRIHDNMPQEDLLALGMELAALKKTLGWRAFESLLIRHRETLGLSSLRDREKPREYWEGQLDCVEQIQASISMMIEQAEEAARIENPKNTQRLFRMISAGSGGL